jgi:hypothetical protein
VFLRPESKSGLFFYIVEGRAAGTPQMAAVVALANQAREAVSDSFNDSCTGL